MVTTYPVLMGNRPAVQKSKEFNLALVTPLLVDRLIAEFGFDQSPYLLDGPVCSPANVVIIVSFPHLVNFVKALNSFLLHSYFAIRCLISF